MQHHFFFFAKFRSVWSLAFWFFSLMFSCAKTMFILVDLFNSFVSFSFSVSISCKNWEKDSSAAVLLLHSGVDVRSIVSSKFLPKPKLKCDNFEYIVGVMDSFLFNDKTKYYECWMTLVVSNCLNTHWNWGNDAIEFRFICICVAFVCV